MSNDEDKVSRVDLPPLSTRQDLPRKPLPSSSVQALVELVAQWRDLTVAPEPRAIATRELLETSPQTARRNWWREGWALAVQQCAEELEAVLALDEDAGENQETVLS